jgi:hypothetical protein
MMNRYAIGVSLLVTLGWGAPRAAAAGAQEIHTTWEGLSAIVGQKVKVVMPVGAQIQGKATAVETDALAIEILKTSNKAAYPKGKYLVPRATLKAVDVERPTKQWRILCTAGGAALGIAFAKLAAGAGGLHTRTEIYGAMAAAAPAVGYLLGRAADRRTVTYVIAQ